MSNGSPRIAVIGAGPAGLTAAFRLQRAGAEVRVFEARSQVGGRMHTDETDGFRIDGAAQLFGSTYTELFGLLRDAGASELARRTDGRDALWRRGRAHEVVYGSTSSMLATGAVPFTLKIRLGAKYLPFLTQHAARLQMHALERAAPLDRDSIGEWGRRELGADFVDTMVHPLLAAGYGGAPEETGAAVYHMMAHHGMTTEVYALRGGAATLCQALAARVRDGGGEVRTSARVGALQLTPGGVHLAGEGWAENFTGAVLAVAARTARELVGDELRGVGEWLASVRYRPHLSLALLLDRPVGVEYFGLSFPRGESEVVAVACVEENKAPELVPAGKGLIVAFPMPDQASRLLEADASSIVETMLPELRRAFPGLESRILRARVYRWAEGVTLFYPGYVDHLQRFSGGAAESEAPLALAGDYLCAPTVEGAVLSGTRAAERLLRRLRAVDTPAAG
ncbi:MAG TPA: FAD-dependent oxidoreductase [Longimicrobiaceae bacterium]|nr:FAD-dependent oxidoreductase [Longimicrobiaceae bacterium]